MGTAESVFVSWLFPVFFQGCFMRKGMKSRRTKRQLETWRLFNYLLFKSPFQTYPRSQKPYHRFLHEFTNPTNSKPTIDREIEGWVCCWFSPLLREVFLRVLRFSPLLKNQHFQIPMHIWTLKKQFFFIPPPLTNISSWIYENRVSKHFVISLNFPCLTLFTVLFA